MTVPADILSSATDPERTMSPTEMESQEPPSQVCDETPLTTDSDTNEPPASDPHDEESPHDRPETPEANEGASPPPSSSSESIAPAATNSKDDEPTIHKPDDAETLDATMITTADDTEVVYVEKPLKNDRRSRYLTILLALLVPFAVALMVALITMAQKDKRQSVQASSSFVLTEDISCGCTTCSASVLARTTPEGTTCLQEITSLMSQLGLEESQACMLVGQQFPNACGDCDASVCNRRVGNCGCPSTCIDDLLGTVVTDQAGSYTCKDRMQFIMDTRGLSESDACDFVSDEFPTVCGSGCRSSVCQAQTVEEGTPQDFEFIRDDDLGDATSSSSDVCPRLVWQDEFNDSSLDTSKWGYQIGDGCDLGLCGWGNAEWQSYTSNNSVLSDGKLVIEARNDNGVYTSTRLNSKGLLDFRYGYVEASIQIPKGNGMWPAFWMLPTDQVYGKWPQSGEIDIMENVGREPDIVHGTIHYGEPWPDNSYSGRRLQLPDGEAYSDNFHTYAVSWEEDRIRWFMDGAEYSRKTPKDTDPLNWPFNHRFHLIMNLAIGGNWPGNPDSSTVFPQQMKVDFVRIYDKPYGRLTGPSVVNETQQGVAFALEEGLTDYTYEWTVPAGAVITSRNPSGSSRISVTFGTQSGYVTVVAKSNKCRSSKRFSMPVLVGEEYQYVPGAKVTDCGCPNTCTTDILDTVSTDTVGSYTCRERIDWVMANRFMVEKEACGIVHEEFPSTCTCNPSSCS